MTEIKTTVYIVDAGGALLDRSKIHQILLTYLEGDALLFDPSKRLDFPGIYPGSNVDLQQIKAKLDANPRLNLYVRLYGGEHCYPAQFKELMEDIDG